MNKVLWIAAITTSIVLGWATVAMAKGLGWS